MLIVEKNVSFLFSYQLKILFAVKQLLIDRVLAELLPLTAIFVFSYYFILKVLKLCLTNERHRHFYTIVRNIHDFDMFRNR